MLSDWSDVTLGDILTLQRGFDITKKDQEEGLVPVVSSAGVKSYHSKAKVTGPGVVIGRKGTLGGVYYISQDFWPHDTTLWVKDFRDNDRKFCAELLLNMSLAHLDVGASNPTLNRNHLHSLSAILPPLPIQKRIAGILSAYDDLIAVNERRIAILEEMARRVFEEWFGGGVIGNANVLRHAPFTEVAEILSGGTPKKSEPNYWDGTIPFYTPRDAPSSPYVLKTISNITEAGLRKCNSKLYPKDTVFITARGTVGKLALASCDMAMNQSCYALKARKGYGQHYLYLLTQSAVRELQGRSQGAVFDTIVVETFEKFLIGIPSGKSVARFEALVSPMFRQLLTLSKANANLRTTRDLLLPRLISGEIDVSKVSTPKAAAE